MLFLTLLIRSKIVNVVLLPFPVFQPSISFSIKVELCQNQYDTEAKLELNWTGIFKLSIGGGFSGSKSTRISFVFDFEEVPLLALNSAFSATSAFETNTGVRIVQLSIKFYLF